LNLLLLALLFFGAVLLFFLLEFIGALINLPEMVVRLSPFHWVQPVPATDADVVGALALVAIGVLGVVAAHVAFARRDLAGA
jgi:ABC-2 type transport system permease protein